MKTKACPIGHAFFYAITEPLLIDSGFQKRAPSYRSAARTGKGPAVFLAQPEELGTRSD